MDVQSKQSHSMLQQLPRGQQSHYRYHKCSDELGNQPEIGSLFHLQNIFLFKPNLFSENGSYVTFALKCRLPMSVSASQSPIRSRISTNSEGINRRFILVLYLACLPRYDNREACLWLSVLPEGAFLITLDSGKSLVLLQLTILLSALLHVGVETKDIFAILRKPLL